MRFPFHPLQVGGNSITKSVSNLTISSTATLNSDKTPVSANVGNRPKCHNAISCVYFNARSLKNKLHQLNVFLDYHLPGIVLICETWLKSSIPNSMLCNTSTYNVIRKDSLDDSGYGGICAFIKSNIKYSTVVIDSKFDILEILCFDIKSDLGDYRYILVYRPPGNDAECKSYACC